MCLEDIDENKNPDKESNLDNIPKYRSFNLYVILICGISISLAGLYLRFGPGERKPGLYFDGENFIYGNINGYGFVFVGLIMSIFPVYHLYKGNHKSISSKS